MGSQMYQQQYGHSQAGPYPSNFNTGGVPTTMTMAPQEHLYDYQTPVSNGSYSWSQPTRSISSNTSEDLSSGYPTPYRTSTYPSFERRMTGPMHQLHPTSSLPMGMDSQQNAAHGEFHEPSSYNSMQMNMQHEWERGGPHPAQNVSGPGVNSYNQSWYPPHSSVTEMRPGEDQPHNQSSYSQNFSRSQHKPG